MALCFPVAEPKPGEGPGVGCGTSRREGRALCAGELAPQEAEPGHCGWWTGKP